MFDLPLGVLGERALRCHVETFGVDLDGVVTCPGCGRRLELGLGVDDLLRQALPPPAVRTLDLGGRRTTVRAPTLRDLLDAADAPDARALILARCAVVGDDALVGAERLSGPDVAALDAALEDLTGLGLVTVRATCPDCGDGVTAVLDPGVLLADRVRVAASVLLGEVARLASAFGWRERDVLALPPARRRAYLELAG
jgi:hypothetical protein